MPGHSRQPSARSWNAMNIASTETDECDGPPACASFRMPGITRPPSIVVSAQATSSDMPPTVRRRISFAAATSTRAAPVGPPGAHARPRPVLLRADPAGRKPVSAPCTGVSRPSWPEWPAVIEVLDVSLTASPAAAAALAARRRTVLVANPSTLAWTSAVRPASVIRYSRLRGRPCSSARSAGSHQLSAVRARPTW